MIVNKKPQVKTERDVERALSIKTEKKPTITNHRSPKVANSNQENNKLFSKIVELQKENQRYVLDLKKKDAAHAVLEREKKKTEAELSEKFVSLTAELNSLRSELRGIKTQWSKQKSDDSKTITELNKKFRLLDARNKQLQTGSYQQYTTHENQNKSDGSLENVFEVEKLIGHKRMKDGLHFLVRWKNFSAKDDTWERESNLMCPETLKDYKRKMNLLSN